MQVETDLMNGVLKFMSSELVVYSLVVAIITNLVKYAFNSIPVFKDIKTNELMMGAALLIGVVLDCFVKQATFSQHLISGATYMAGSVVAYNAYSNLLSLANLGDKVPGPLK